MLALLPAGVRADEGSLPRFAELRAERTNVRSGPGTDYPIRWTYVRSGLPVEIFQTFENWRRIRDWEGQTGWVHHALLKSSRAGLVTPWSRGKGAKLRRLANEAARITAHLAPRVQVRIIGCDGTWCRVSVRRLNGFVKQDRLWGAYPGEVIR